MPADVERVVRFDTRLIVLNHASDVVGSIPPVCEVSQIAGWSGVLLLVDAALTAELHPVDAVCDGFDQQAGPSDSCGR